jgi:hypothetical protein
MFGILTYAGLFILLAAASLVRPPIALAAVLCLFGLKQWGQNATEILAQHALFTNVSVGVLVVIAVVRLAFKRGCLFCRFPPAAMLVVALYLYALTTTIWSPDPESVADAWTWHVPYIITVVLLAPLLAGDMADLRAGFFLTMLVGGIICFLAVVFGTWGLRGLEVSIPSLDSSETNGLALASLGGTVTLAAAAFFLERRANLLRLIAAVCIPLALAVIIRSGARGQLLALLPAFAVAGSIVFRLSSPRSMAALLLMTVFLVALGWWGSTLVEVSQARWTGTDAAADAIQGRLDMAQELLRAALAHPTTMIFGLGNSSAYQVVGIYPHITILEVIAEEGIPGTMLYLAVLWCAIRSILRLAKSVGRDEATRRTLAILAALFVYELITSWKQGSLLGSFYVFSYAIILGRMESLIAVRLRVEIPTERLSAPLFPNLMR